LNPEGQRKDPLHKKKNPKILSVSWFCAAMLLLPLLIRSESLRAEEVLLSQKEGYGN